MQIVNLWEKRHANYFTRNSPRSSCGMQATLKDGHYGKSVIMRRLEGPLSHKDQGDCRGGNKTDTLIQTTHPAPPSPSLAAPLHPAVSSSTSSPSPPISPTPASPTFHTRPH